MPNGHLTNVRFQPGRGLSVPFTSNHKRSEQPVALTDLFHVMWNTQDVSGVLQRFSEDGVVTIVSRQHHSSVVYRGQRQIRALCDRPSPAAFSRRGIIMWWMLG